MYYNIIVYRYQMEHYVLSKISQYYNKTFWAVPSLAVHE